MPRLWTPFITDYVAHRKHERVSPRIFSSVISWPRLQMSLPWALHAHMKRVVAGIWIVGMILSQAQARDSLGVFGGWGAFRDPSTPRCYAIAEPSRSSAGKASWRAFASVGTWPRQRTRGQLHIRLSRETAAGAKVYLSIGERRFALISGKADAWAQDARMDAAIVAAMRSTETMSVESTGTKGNRFSDLYELKGAATAMDAAALGCANV